MYSFYKGYCFSFIVFAYILNFSGLHIGSSLDFVYNSCKSGTPQITGGSLLQMAENTILRDLAACLQPNITTNDVKFRVLLKGRWHTFYFTNLDSVMFAFNKSSHRGVLNDLTLQRHCNRIFICSHNKNIIVEVPMIMLPDMLNNIILRSPSYTYPINGDSIHVLNQLLFHQPYIYDIKLINSIERSTPLLVPDNLSLVEFLEKKNYLHSLNWSLRSSLLMASDLPAEAKRLQLLSLLYETSYTGSNKCLHTYYTGSFKLKCLQC